MLTYNAIQEAYNTFLYENITFDKWNFHLGFRIKFRILFRNPIGLSLIGIPF